MRATGLRHRQGGTLLPAIAPMLGSPDEPPIARQRRDPRAYAGYGTDAVADRRWVEPFGPARRWVGEHADVHDSVNSVEMVLEYLSVHGTAIAGWRRARSCDRTSAGAP